MPDGSRSFRVVEHGSRDHNLLLRGALVQYPRGRAAIIAPPDVLRWGPVIVSFVHTAPPQADSRSDGRTFAKYQGKEAIIDELSG